MVSKKKQSKEGVFLLRKTVKEGNEVRHIISAGAGVHLLRPTRCLEVPLIKLAPVKLNAAPTNLASSVIAAEKHIQKFTASRGKNNPLESVKFQIASSKVDSPLRVDEYLEGTPILYKAVLALRSRYGNYLTFSESLVDVSTQSPGPTSQFVIMNAENLADDGNMNYGNAVWLVVENRRVLGSQHTGVGESRQLSPTLIKCTKSHLNRAHHTGKWIIMNRDDPLGMMGRTCHHGDRILLEQEWMFLCSSSPEAVTLYRTKNNIANITDRHIGSSNIAVDYFDPIEDCAWRVELVEQKDMGATDGKKRAELLSKAKSQLSSSIKARSKLKTNSFGLLSEKVDQNKEYLKISKSISHKLSEDVDQEYLLKLYGDISSRKFIQPLISKPIFRSGDYTYSDTGLIRRMFDTRSVGDTGFQSISDSSKQDDPEIEGFALREPSPLRGKYRKRPQTCPGGSSPGLNNTALGSTNDCYWKVAQKLLVSTHAWSVLDTAMEVYYHGPSRQIKTKSAIIIQKFVRSRCKFLGMTESLMDLVDCRTLLSLRKKKEWRGTFIVELDAKRATEQKERSAAFMLSYGDDKGTAQSKCSLTSDTTCGQDGAECDTSAFKHQPSVGMSDKFGSDIFFSISPDSSETACSKHVEDVASHDDSQLGAVSPITITPFTKSVTHTEEGEDGQERVREDEKGEKQGGNRYNNKGGIPVAPAGPHQQHLQADEISAEISATVQIGSARSRDCSSTPSHGRDADSCVRPKTAPVSCDSKKCRDEWGRDRGDGLKSIDANRLLTRHANMDSMQVEEGLQKAYVMNGIQRRRLRQADRVKRTHARETDEKVLIDKLCLSEGNPYGLPSDVFERMQDKVSRRTGGKFLSTVSPKYSAYI